MQHFLFDYNPFIWPDTAIYINSAVQSPGVKKCDNSEVLFNPAPDEDPFQIVTGRPGTVTNMTFTNVSDTSEELVLHHFITTDPTEYVQLFFEPLTPNMTFELYISFNNTPDNVHFDYNNTLPLNGTTPELDDNGLPLNPLSILLPRNVTGLLGNYTVAVWVKGQYNINPLTANRDYHTYNEKTLSEMFNIFLRRQYISPPLTRND